MMLVGPEQNKYYKLIGVQNCLQNAIPNDLHPGDAAAIVDEFDLWSQLPAMMLLECFVRQGSV